MASCIISIEVCILQLDAGLIILHENVVNEAVQRPEMQLCCSPCISTNSLCEIKKGAIHLNNF